MDSLLTTVEQAAKELQISPRQVYRLLEKGEIPVVKIGHLTRISSRDLEDYVAENRRRVGEETVGAANRTTET